MEPYYCEYSEQGKEGFDIFYRKAFDSKRRIAWAENRATAERIIELLNAQGQK